MISTVQTCVYCCDGNSEDLTDSDNAHRHQRPTNTTLVHCGQHQQEQWQVAPAPASKKIPMIPIPVCVGECMLLACTRVRSCHWMCPSGVETHTNPPSLEQAGTRTTTLPSRPWAGQPETKCPSPVADKQRVTRCTPQPEVILTEGLGPTDTWPGQSQSHPEHGQCPQTHDPMGPIPALILDEGPTRH